MASNTICTTCLRHLRHQARKIPRSTLSARQPTQPIRSFSSIPSRLADNTSTDQKPNPSSSRTSQAPPPPRSSPSQPDPMQSFVSNLRASSALKSTTEPYIAYGSTEDLFAACAATCTYTVPSRTLSPPQDPPRTASGEDLGEGQGWWFAPKSEGGLGLDVTFNSWAQVLYLHMYILTVRLRAFPAEHARIWHQNLLDHFFYAAEDRMATWHGMSARSVRNRYLKDIYTQWRGVLFSYDEGLVRGDAVLASAVWRNVFKASEDAEVGDVAAVTAYLRRELARVEALGDERIGAGEVGFGEPRTAREVLRGVAQGMREKFAAADDGVREAVLEARGAKAGA